MGYIGYGIAFILVTGWIYWTGLEDIHNLEAEREAQYGEEGPAA